MTDKLKYKVGDKVLVEAEVTQIDGIKLPYKVDVLGTFLAWFSEDGLDKAIVHLQPKPKVPQAVMDFWERHKDSKWGFSEWFDFMSMPDEVQDWTFESVVNQHALATLITYGPEAVEVEKEKKYRVVFKSSGQVLCKVNDHNADKIYFMFLHSKPGADGMCYPKQELIDAGFEGVFDNEMFEVEEVGE